MFNDIFSLANSFGTTFGLTGNPEPLNGDYFCDDYILKLEVKEHLKEYISKEEAMEIFDLVTTAFMKGSKWDCERSQKGFEFDRENLTIIEYDLRHKNDNE